MSFIVFPLVVILVAYFLFPGWNRESTYGRVSDTSRIMLWCGNSVLIAFVLCLSVYAMIVLILFKSTPFRKLCYLVSLWSWLAFYLFMTRRGNVDALKLIFLSFVVSVFLLLVGIFKNKKEWKDPLLAAIYNLMFGVTVYFHVFTWLIVYD